MPTDFDADTAIGSQGDGRWETHLGDRWSIGVVPNGGYSTAPVVRAICAETERDHPLSVTTHFFKPAVQSAGGSITVEQHRAGFTFANATGTLTQEGLARSRTMAVLGSLPDDGPEPAVAPPPIDIPDPDECRVREAEAQGVSLPLMEVVDVRLHPDGPTVTDAGPVTLAGWVRFRDERPPDPLALTFLADAFPPAVLGLIPEVGWVPTLELTVHVRRQPVDGWIRASITSSDVQGKLLIEDVLLWDDSGALVAQARQLAMPLPKSKRESTS